MLTSSSTNGNTSQEICPSGFRLMFHVQFVPTINGYKRLLGGEAFWAPNAITYGYDSRAASIRIISPPIVPLAATRFEVRVPGADMNPYIALSAIFGLGLRGIEKKLSLPGPPISQLSPEDKNVSPSIDRRFDLQLTFVLQVRLLPTSLETATERMMRPDSIAREVFGDEFVDHYGGSRQHEVNAWNQAVTDWESKCQANPVNHLRRLTTVVKRYLELV